MIITEREKVCAVVVSFNGGETIKNTVSALKKQVDFILIIDNNSNKNTKDILVKLENNKIKTIYNEKNYGIARALNKGVVFAKRNNFKWVLTMDQDSIAENKMVDKMLECAKFYANNGRIVSFSPNILHAAREGYKNRKKKLRLYQERLTVITSGNLIKIDVFNEFIKYEEKLFIDSVDFDFCLKLRINGYKIIRCYNASLTHELGEVKFRKIFDIKMHYHVHSYTRKYYIMRNNIYILKKYFLGYPVFCIKKQLFIFIFIIQSIILEKNKLLNVKYLIKGLIDGIHNKYD
jgi:rhamnosyltransferase